MFHRLVGLTGVLAVAACTPVAPQKSVVLVDGDVIAQMPAGYCVDIAASRARDGFAVVAPCATLGEAEAAPLAIGIATIQVGAGGTASVAGNETQMRDFFSSDAGAVLLSSDGRAGSIDVISARASSGRVSVHFKDSETPPIAGQQDEEWRAFKDVNGRLVTIALRGLAAAPLDANMAGWLLGMFANGVKPATTPPANQAPDN